MESETSSTAEKVDAEWHRMSAYMSFGEKRFKEERFLEVIGEDSIEDGWLFWGGEETQHHAHVNLSRIDEESRPEVIATEDEPSEEPEVPDWTIAVRYYPDPLPERVQESESWKNADLLFKALREAVDTDDPYHPLYSVDFFFDVPTTTWRFPLLADPPEMEDLDTELGTISLAGVTLRFTDSPAGLWQASLETSPAGDEYYLGLRFAEHLEAENINSLFRKGLDRGQELATLFVNRPENQEE